MGIYHKSKIHGLLLCGPSMVPDALGTDKMTHNAVNPSVRRKSYRKKDERDHDITSTTTTIDSGSGHEKISYVDRWKIPGTRYHVGIVGLRRSYPYGQGRVVSSYEYMSTTKMHGTTQDDAGMGDIPHAARVEACRTRFGIEPQHRLHQEARDNTRPVIHTRSSITTCAHSSERPVLRIWGLENSGWDIIVLRIYT